MFLLEQLVPLLPEGHIITILDVNSNRLFVATCPAMIPSRYRDRNVLSVVQGVGEVTIKLCVLEVR